MDWIEIRRKGMTYVRKYRYVFLILFLGIALMQFPSQTDPGEEVQELSRVTGEETEDLQTRLEQILSDMDGAGNVQVLLTQAEGERILYQTDEDISTGENSDSVRRDTVILSDSSRTEAGLVQQVQPPVYLGAVVLCQGADSAAVRLAIVDAVSKATGLGTNKIAVLKMKG